MLSAYRLTHTLALVLMITALLASNSDYAWAQSSSASFRNIAESINCGGGVSASASFKLSDSICETAPGGEVSTSASFANVGGFQAMEDIPRITFTVSSNTVPLGTLTTGSVATASITTSVTTNAVSGYVATIRADGPLTNGAQTIAPVTDSSVTAGSEEYGFSTTGPDGLYNSADQGIATTPTDYASNTGPTQSSTTLTFKAAIAPITAGGSYTQTVYLVASGRF